MWNIKRYTAMATVAGAVATVVTGPSATVAGAVATVVAAVTALPVTVAAAVTGPSATVAGAVATVGAAVTAVTGPSATVGAMGAMGAMGTAAAVRTTGMATEVMFCRTCLDIMDRVTRTQPTPRGITIIA